LRLCVKFIVFFNSEYISMIYVLGGEGFVGSAFARHCRLHELDHQIVERDNYQQFVGGRCDILINANGNSKKYLAREDPLEEFAQSVRSARASLVDFRADLYVHLSTCDVYPDCSTPETTRESIHLDVARQSAYGFHKYLAEQCVQHAAPRWLIARLGGMVGPGMKKNPVFDILHEQALWLDPESQLQFLHTDSVARIIFDLIENGTAREIINICGDGLISLQDIADMAGKAVRVQPESPKVRYNVSIGKLQAIRPVPQTRDTLGAFLLE
jgi:nucleoside-diphosphate-sugar epimerase